MHTLSAQFKGAVALVTAAALAACSNDLTAPNAAVPHVSRSTSLAPEAPAFSVASAKPAGQAITPTLPKYSVVTTYPSASGRQIHVRAGDDLQTAIDTARLGDELLLQPGATYAGPFTLRAKPAGTTYIVIRTDATLPQEGVRMTPTLARNRLAKIVTPNRGVAIKTAAGAHHYRLVGLEITSQAPSGTVAGLINLGDGSTAQNTAAEIPSYLILDRVYVHGTPTMDLKRCVSLQSAWTAIVDSYISDCHSNAVESQAIAAWNGPGPYKIVNNYVEGSTENIMFGGANPAIRGMMPSDITIQRNYFTKPVSWKGVWKVKTTFELKFAQRVLIESNIIENSWVDGQTGYALNFKTASSGSTPWVATQDITFRYNIVRNASAGLSLAANPDNKAIPANRILITENLFAGIGTFNGTTNGRMLQILDDLKDVTISHNTFVPNTTDGIAIVMDGNETGSNFAFTDNVMFAGAQGMSGSGYGEGSRAFDHYFSSYTFSNNVLVGFNEGSYPTRNYFPSTAAAAGLVAQSDRGMLFSSTSPYYASGTAGSTPGVSMSAVISATSGVSVP